MKKEREGVIQVDRIYEERERIKGWERVKDCRIERRAWMPPASSMPRGKTAWKALPPLHVKSTSLCRPRPGKCTGHKKPSCARAHPRAHTCIHQNTTVHNTTRASALRGWMCSTCLIEQHPPLETLMNSRPQNLLSCIYLHLTS